MNDQIWSTWKRDWEWVLSAMRRKGALIRPELQIAAATSMKAVRTLERQLGIVLPDDFTKVVTGFSAAVAFSWSLYDRTGGYLAVPPAGYEDCARGGGDFELWSFEKLPLANDRLLGWAATRGLASEGADGQAWRNKTAFLFTASGDLYAFDMAKGRRNCPVVYLDHEHGPHHGIRLGLSFVDFATRWSNLGCPGLDIQRMMPFYDPDQNLLLDAGQAVEKWKQWVSG